MYNTREEELVNRVKKLHRFFKQKVQPMPRQSLTAMKVAFGVRAQYAAIALVATFMLTQVIGVVIFSGNAQAIGAMSYSSSITTGFDGALVNPQAIAFSPDGQYYYIFSSNDTKLHKYSADGTALSTWTTSISGVRSLVVGHNGFVYVLDGYMVHKLDGSDGTLITEWGDTSPGNVGGEFNSAYDIAVDSSDNVYVVDGGQSYVFAFDQDGAYISEWGGPGGGNSNLLAPTGIAIDKHNQVYVANAANGRIKKFTTGGSFISQPITVGLGSNIEVDVDRSDRIFVSIGSSFTKYAADGTVISAYTGAAGSGPGQFNATDPYGLGNFYGLKVAPNGQIYKVDVGNNRVQIFDDDSFDLRLTTNDASSVSSVAATTSLQTSDLAGSTTSTYSIDYGTTISYGSNTLTGTDAVAKTGSYALSAVGWTGTLSTAQSGGVRDSQGNFYTYNGDWPTSCRILKFDSSGSFLYQLGGACSGAATAMAWNTGSLAVDALDNLYVADETNSSYIKKFDKDGNYVSSILMSGGEEASSIAVDPLGNVYVGTFSNRKIMKFNSSGNFVTEWGSAGSGDGQFSSNTIVVATADNGDVYARNGGAGQNRVQRFASDGTYVGQWSVGDAYGGLVVDANTTIYAQTASNTVTMYDASGSILGTIVADSVANKHSLLRPLDPAGTIEIITSDTAGTLDTYGRGATASLGSLTCGTMYHYRAKATSGSDTVYGADQTFTTDACLDITTTSLPDGTVGAAYSQSVTTNRGDVTISLASGSLPSGLSLASSGVITGTPTAAGTYNFSLLATDNGTSETDTQALQIVVGEVPPPAFNITTTSLPDGLVYEDYDQNIDTDSDSPVSFTVQSGSLPDGLDLSSSGSISGTPTTAGTFNFVVLGDNGSVTDTQPLQITIAEAEVVPETVDEEPSADEEPTITDVTPEPSGSVAETPAKTTPLLSSPQAVATQNTLFALAKRIPEPFAIAFPWLLLLLALTLVGIQYYQVHSESVATQKLKANVERQERLVDEQNNFVALSTHYLHTPLTVMEGEITLMVKAGTLSQDQANKLQATLVSLNAEAEAVLAEEEQHESGV